MWSIYTVIHIGVHDAWTAPAVGGHRANIESSYHTFADWPSFYGEAGVMR